MRRLLLLTIVAAGVALGARPAMAHGGEVQLEVVDATPDDTGSAVTYRVALTYVNDGDGINGALITGIGTSETSSTAPVTLDPTDEDGVYAGTISFLEPGDWVVRFATADPEASLAVTFTVEEPAPPTTAPPAVTVPAGPVTSTATHPDLAEDDTDVSSGPPAGLIAGLVVSGVAVVVIAVALLIRRRRSGSTP